MSQAPYSGKPNQDLFLNLAAEAGYVLGEAILGYPEIDSVIDGQVDVDGKELKRPWWLINAPEHRAGRGQFKLPTIGQAFAETLAIAKRKASAKPAAPGAVAAAVAANSDSVPEADRAQISIQGVSAVLDSAVPIRNPHFVKFGHFKDVKTIIESGIFYPTFVTGLSGNGKTFMVEQACAHAKREMFRVNITVETDEDDLLGGFRLIDGETKWFDGPVIEAMRRGAILLLDEVDLGSNKIMCLQPVLEGKPVLLKKINEIVTPAEGFNIIATANTKGKGSDDGRFVGTMVMNGGIPRTIRDHDGAGSPSVAVETRIVAKTLKVHGAEDKDFATKLANFAKITRDAFMEGVNSDLIATRRLDHIAKAFAIFGDRKKAVAFACNRFDDETRGSFLDLWDAIDAPVVEDKAFENAEAPKEPTGSDKGELNKEPF